jgi:hypothetical protein
MNRPGADRMNAADKFVAFHQANPGVYAKLHAYALEARAAAREHIGIAMLIERFRWYTAVETTDPDFKVANNHKPYYARLLMRNDPNLAGLFVLHTIRYPLPEGVT